MSRYLNDGCDYMMSQQCPDKSLEIHSQLGGTRAILLGSVNQEMVQQVDRHARFSICSLYCARGYTENFSLITSYHSDVFGGDGKVGLWKCNNFGLFVYLILSR